MIQDLHFGNIHLIPENIVQGKKSEYDDYQMALTSFPSIGSQNNNIGWNVGYRVEQSMLLPVRTWCGARKGKFTLEGTS